MHVSGMFYDLAKGIDCVNHESLLTKLRYFGTKGSMANWLSYLTGRKPKIKIKSPYTTQSTHSNWGTIEHGIPQRSILGPLLLYIYTYALPPTINTLAVPIIFADDTIVIITSKNLDDFYMLSTRVASLMGKWFAANKLTINLDKIN
jgi:hypothetical protein